MTLDGHEPTQAEASIASKDTLPTRVLVLWESGGGTYFLRPGESLTIGRQRDCEILIALRSVSRRHARLSAPSGKSGSSALASIEDMGGGNGVRVRGQHLPMNASVPVGAGDVIELGGAIAVLHPPTVNGAPSVGPIVRPAAHRPSNEDPMKAVDRLIDVVAQTDLGVLFLGETGVGKTIAAEAVHGRSARAAGPLVRLDCAALPEVLVESEQNARRLENALFGSERGEDITAGLLESASGGTILLDEIGDMPFSTQAKLLAAIKACEVQRLGGGECRPLDVRFVCTTNRDLLAKDPRPFLLDLFYLLNGISIVIPPLRERMGEIRRFAAKFLGEAAARSGEAPARLSNEALGALVHHPFVGNLRELKATMERAHVHARGGFVGREHLAFDTGSPSSDVVTSPRPMPPIYSGRFAAISATEPPGPSIAARSPVVLPAPPRTPTIEVALDDPEPALERARIVSTLEECNGNQPRAAEVLGMSRRALIARMDHHGLPRPRKK